MKKFNFIKYIFIVFVIILIGYAIYHIRKQEKNREEDIITEVVEVEEKTTITTLRLSAVKMDTLNPIISRNQNIQDISKLIYEPMLTITQDFRIENCLAKEWISLNDTIYVVVLKEGVMWHNGEEVTAEDVRYTIEQIKEIGNDCIYYYNIEHIISADVISDYTIKITIDEKIPFFEYNLTFPIMSSRYFNGESMMDSDKINYSPGTGKYLVTNISSTEIDLKINEKWWGLENNKTLSLQTILIKLYSSMGEAYNAFKLGNIDLIATQSLNYEEYIGTIGYKTAEYVGREHEYLALNCEIGSLSYKELRQAINYAIDKSNIVATIYENKYYIADFPLNSSSFLYKIDKLSSNYNTNKSKEIMEEAGWQFRSGNWIKEQDYYNTNAMINFVVNQENENRLKVAEIIKKQLEDFGILVNLIQVKNDQYNKYLANKNYDMILTGKLSGISPYLSSYISEGNLSNYNNKQLTELLNEIYNMTDEQNEIIGKYKKVIKLIEEDRPFISLFFNKNTVIYNQNIQGNINPNFYNIFYNIEDWIIQY